MITALAHGALAHGALAHGALAHGALAAKAAGPSGCTISPSASVTGFCATRHSLHIPVAYFSIMPILVLAAGALVLLAVAAVLPKRPRPGLWSLLTGLIAGGATIVAAFNWYDVGKNGASATIGDQIIYDRFTVLFYVLIGSATLLSALLADSYLQREGLDGPEAYVLMLMCSTGGMLMAASGGLVMLFLGLEILSISLYVMSAFHRRRLQSGEAGLKYFILGSFSSAIFLYGAALIYGSTGSTQFGEIGAFLATNALRNNGVLLAGMSLLVVGLGFKVAAVPFHFWTPDVYQGAPTPFTGYMAAVAKAAGFAGLLRVLLEALPTQSANWRPAIWLLAVLTLLVGSVLAIVQKDIKRMLAYSSISQAGYVLIGLQAGSKQGTAGALFYLLTYTFVVIGSFAVVQVIQGRGERRNDLGAIRGLARRRPVLALAMLVFLLAQAGIPFTSGFLAKFYVISASVQQGQYPLAIIGMLASVVAAFFYLRVGLLMYAPEVSVGGVQPAPAVGAASGAASGGASGAEGEGAGVTSTPPAAGSGPAAGAVAAEGGLEGALLAGLDPGEATVGNGSSEAGSHGSGDDGPGDAGPGDAGPGDAGPGGSGSNGHAPVLEDPETSKIRIPFTVGVTLAVCVAFTIFAGVSGPVLDFAKQATMLF